MVRDGSNRANRDGTADLGGDAGVIIDGGRITSIEGLLAVDRVEFNLLREVSYSVAFSTAVVARSVRTRTCASSSSILACASASPSAWDLHDVHSQPGEGFVMVMLAVDMKGLCVDEACVYATERNESDLTLLPAWGK